MSNFNYYLSGFFVAFILGASACTTKIDKATDAYNLGDFQTAADAAEKIAPNIKKDGMKRFDVQYERDELWVGLEKSKMLGEAGKMNESVDAFECVDKRAQFLCNAESWYAKNPLDMSNWDAGQFAEDAGKAFVGADQTTYILQPYEMILGLSYASLNSLLGDIEGAEQFAAMLVKIQQFEKEDLKRGGYDDIAAPTGKMDGALKTVLAGKSSNFSFGPIFSLGDFTGAKSKMKSTIDAARAVNAANPLIPFSTVVQWAAFVKAGRTAEAEGAAKDVSETSGAKTLSEQMSKYSKTGSGDFVLVLIDAGRGPIRQFFEVKSPIIIPNVGSTFFRAVYPELKFRVADRPSDIRVGGGGALVTASILDSIDAIAARNFQRRELELWWTPTIRAVFRAVVTIVAQATQKEEDKTTKFLIGLAGTVVAAAEQPDLRAWSSLPASQYAAIIPRPADGVVKIELKSQASIGSVQVKVGPGASIVYVRALTPSIRSAQTASLSRKK